MQRLFMCQVAISGTTMPTLEYLLGLLQLAMFSALRSIWTTSGSGFAATPATGTTMRAMIRARTRVELVSPAYSHRMRLIRLLQFTLLVCILPPISARQPLRNPYPVALPLGVENELVVGVGAADFGLVHGACDPDMGSGVLRWQKSIRVSLISHTGIRPMIMPR